MGRQRVLLAALVLQPGKPIAADALTEVVWDGSPPSSAAVTLRSHVLRLRRQLGPRAGARLVTRYPGYLLEAGEDEVDVLRFRRLCRDGGAALREGAWGRAHELFSSALGLWRGAPLADIPSESLRRDECPDLETLRLQAEEWRIDAALQLGGHAELVPGLHSLAARHPLRERFHGQLMVALYRCGRQAEALAAYQRARDIMVAELGVEPGPDLRELHQQILSANPTLAITEAPRSAKAEPARVTPRQLPPAVPSFTGRSAELRELTRLLDWSGGRAPGTVVISAIGGTAGVGKTALAVHWAHQAARRFPDGQLYVNLRGYDLGQPLSATDALAGFLRSLGVPGHDIPPEEDERAARYRSLLAGQRMLVVLDNAVSADQIRPLLPGTPHCAVVVTSRDALAGLVARDGATRLDLDMLPLEDAVALLRTLIGARVGAEPGAAAELAAQCCRLPLALRVAAELAANRQAMPLAALTAELTDLRTRLDLLETGGDPRTQVRTVFSWSYGHLDAADARTFRLLGLHPGPDFELYAAAALTGSTVPQARGALDVLTRAHLLSPTSPGRYGMHDLLRSYACELPGTLDIREEQRSALTRLFDHYLHTATRAMDALVPAERHRRPQVPAPSTPSPRVSDPARAQAWLDDQRANLVAVARDAAEHGRPGHAIKLAAVLFRYLDTGSHYPEALVVHGCARTAASQLGDRTAEAVALNALAGAHYRQGRCQYAADHLQQALNLFRQVGDYNGQARALDNLGIVFQDLGRHEHAADLIKQAVEIFHETGDRYGEATALTNLGCVRMRQGRYRQAVTLHQRALMLAERLGDQSLEGYSLGNLGTAYRRQGRSRLAITTLQRALLLFRDARDRVGEADVLIHLGGVYLEQRRLEQADNLLQKALVLTRETGELAGEAAALAGLGEILLVSNAPEQARTQYTLALNLARQTGDETQLARAYDGLAATHQATGNADLACYYWQQALARNTALDAREADRIRVKIASTSSEQGPQGVAGAAPSGITGKVG